MPIILTSDTHWSGAVQRNRWQTAGVVRCIEMGLGRDVFMSAIETRWRLDRSSPAFKMVRFKNIKIKKLLQDNADSQITYLGRHIA